MLSYLSIDQPFIILQARRAFAQGASSVAPCPSCDSQARGGLVPPEPTFRQLARCFRPEPQPRPPCAVGEADHLQFDIAFLGSGILFVTLGLVLIAKGRADGSIPARGER